MEVEDVCVGKREECEEWEERVCVGLAAWKREEWVFVLGWCGSGGGSGGSSVWDVFEEGCGG